MKAKKFIDKLIKAGYIEEDEPGYYVASQGYLLMLADETEVVEIEVTKKTVVLTTAEEAYYTYKFKESIDVDCYKKVVCC